MMILSGCTLTTSQLIIIKCIDLHLTLFQDYKMGLAITEVELTAANIKHVDRKSFEINTPFKNFWYVCMCMTLCNNLFTALPQYLTGTNLGYISSGPFLSMFLQRPRCHISNKAATTLLDQRCDVSTITVFWPQCVYCSWVIEIM